MKACDDNEPSCNLVLEYLYIGDKRTARDLAFLKGLGVTHVLNATSEVRNYFEKEPGFSYFNTPCMDTDAADLSPFFDAAVAFIHEARQEGHSVLVHCQQGVSRSAALVLAYLIKADKKTLTEAYTLLRNKRSSCKVRPNFLKQLVTWEKGLKPQHGPEEKRSESTKRKGPEASPSPEPREVDAAESDLKPSEPKVVKGPQLPPTKGPLKGPQLPIKGPTKDPPPLDPKPTNALLDEKAAFFNNRKAKSFGSSLPV